MNDDDTLTQLLFDRYQYCPSEKVAAKRASQEIRCQLICALLHHLVWSGTKQEMEELHEFAFFIVTGHFHGRDGETE